MKVLFVSSKGDAAPFAFRLQNDAHDVKLYIKNDEHDLWAGIMDKIPVFGEALEEDRLVVFDRPGGGRTADRLRRQGHSVIGAGRYQDRLAFSQDFAIDELKNAGVRIHPSFGTLQDISIGLEAYFNGSRWLFPMFLVLQWHRLMVGDLGPWIGSTGTIVITLNTDTAPIVTDTLYKLTSAFQHRKYIGAFGLTADTQTLEVRSLRTYFDSNVMSASRHLIKGDILGALASRNSHSFETDNAIAMTVRMTTPRPAANQYITGVEHADIPMLDFFDVKLDPAGDLITAGASTHILNCSLGGGHISTMNKAIWSLLHKIVLPDKQYRVDIGLGLPDLDWSRLVGTGKWPASGVESNPSNTETTSPPLAVPTNGEARE